MLSAVPSLLSRGQAGTTIAKSARYVCYVVYDSLCVGPFLDVVAGGNGTTREIGLEQVRKKIADTKYTNETLGESSRRDVQARGTNNGVERAKRPYSSPLPEGGM